MSRNISTEFHNSHIKWVLFAYAFVHLLFAGAGFCLSLIVPEKYISALYILIGIELVLAAECFIIRPFLKGLCKSGLSLLFLYLLIRIIKNAVGAIFLLVAFPNMFPDLLTLLFSKASTLFSSGMSVFLVAPAFVVCLSNLFLCTSSLIYYLKRKNLFK